MCTCNVKSNKIMDICEHLENGHRESKQHYSE